MSKAKPQEISLTEFYEFQKSLSDDWYFDGIEGLLEDDFFDGKFDPNGVIVIEPWAITMNWQGEEDAPGGIDHLDALTEFNHWKDAQTFDIVTIKVPKGKKSEILEIIKEKYGDIK